MPFGFLQIVINGIVLTYEPPEELRDVLLFLTSGALLVLMSYVTYTGHASGPARHSSGSDAYAASGVLQ